MSGDTTKVTVTDVTMQHRLGHTTVTVVAPDGHPLVGTPVEVRQISHDFLFGNLLFDYIDLVRGTSDDQARDQAELNDWAGLFNYGTLPFYWRGYEPVQGQPSSAALLMAAHRFRDLGITLKGHPLTWHTECPRWLLGRPLPSVESALRGRITREVSQFAGVIDIWDAINELVIMPVFKAEENGITPLCRAKGRMAMGRLAFETAKAANPGVTLLLNDFDLTTAYECLIEGLLEAGVPIDVIGLQTHMHQGYRGTEAIMDRLDRFARYGLPLHFTEVSLVSGHLMPSDIVDLNDFQVEDWPSTPDGEARQSAEIVDLYKTLLAHPAVQAITYWGLTDRTAWLGAPIGFLRADGSKKPSYDALLGLIKGAWWVPPTRAVTNAAGQIDVTGFKGVYQVSVVGGEQQARWQLGATPELVFNVSGEA